MTHQLLTIFDPNTVVEEGKQILGIGKPFYQMVMVIVSITLPHVGGLPWPTVFAVGRAIDALVLVTVLYLFNLVPAVRVAHAFR